MKIELQTVGKNRLTAINLVKQYGAASLAVANEIVKQVPATFKSKYPYEKLDEILDDFARAGCQISIETGHTKESASNSETGRLMRLLFSKSKQTAKKDAEKLVLTNKEEVVSFLKNRQDYPRAIGSGVLAVLAVWIMFGVYFFTSDFFLDDFYTATINILAGLLIGLSVRTRGRGVEAKFGMAAAVLTGISAFGIFYIFKAAMVFREDYPYTFFLETIDLEDIYFTGSMLLAAVFSYFTAFEHIQEEPVSDEEFAANSNNPVSKLSEIKRNTLKKQVLIPHEEVLEFKALVSKPKEKKPETKKIKTK